MVLHVKWRNKLENTYVQTVVPLSGCMTLNMLPNFSESLISPMQNVSINNFQIVLKTTLKTTNQQLDNIWCIN